MVKRFAESQEQIRELQEKNLSANEELKNLQENKELYVQKINNLEEVISTSQANWEEQQRDKDEKLARL